MSAHPLRRYAVVLGVCVLAGGIAGGLSGGLAAVLGSTSPLSLAVTVVATTLGMAAGIWACLRWWRTLDEAAQEAHKWAWWWGSTGGLALGGIALLTVMIAALDRDLVIALPAQNLIYLAALGTVGVQATGYGIAWAVWWLKRR
ncbi:hypothetical protein [Brevundimonas sp. R86498]|uniref:hypothetical protein n=1 Tax=Brevundimonas sp. R86498 TaxID=3093845 RepID=UPI0037C7E330